MKLQTKTKQLIFALSCFFLIRCIQNNTNQEIYSTVDEMPEFPGGNSKMLEFIRENINYQSGVNDSLPGFEACIEFIVEKDGSLTNIESISKVVNCPRCDKEAIRIIKSMPIWKPAKHEGELVRYKYHLFIPFKTRAIDNTH